MKELFLPYEESLELKNLGFNEPCFAYYDLEHNFKWVKNQQVLSNKYLGYHLVPLYTQAFRFFRDKYNLILDILPFYDEEQLPLSYQNQQKPKGYFIWNYYDDSFEIENSINYKTYEEAELECIKQLIKIVKNEIK